MVDPLSSLDAFAGDAIERAIRRRHRRRLETHGWARALAPAPGGWSAGPTPPRAGCQLDVLIDGTEAFAAMAKAIRGARQSIWVAGWFINPSFQMVRGEDGQSIGGLLAEAAERIDVRVLLWAGSPIRLFQPNRAQAKQARSEMNRGSRIRCELDACERTLNCHHEKTMVVDGEIAFVGGIDITDLKNDRFDSPDHPARYRSGWHDVGTRLTGPAVADVAASFAKRWQAVTGEHLALADPPTPTGSHTVQVTSTIPEKEYDFLPDGDFSILETYVAALRDAERYIYLENQFLWAPEITDLLAEKLAHPPRDDFRLLIVLPSKAHAGQDDTLGQLGVLVDADKGDRMLVATLRAVSGDRVDSLYLHSKVAVVDDRWLTVGSANLNAHSLLNDTEMNVVANEEELARDTRLRLWAEHLEVTPAELELRSPCEVIDELWRPIAVDQLQRMRDQQPPTHRLLAMSHVSRRSKRLLGPLNGLLEDG